MRFGFSVLAAALPASVRGLFSGAIVSPFPEISAPASIVRQAHSSRWPHLQAKWCP